MLLILNTVTILYKYVHYYEHLDINKKKHHKLAAFFTYQRPQPKELYSFVRDTKTRQLTAYHDST